MTLFFSQESLFLDANTLKNHSLFEHILLETKLLELSVLRMPKGKFSIPNLEFSKSFQPKSGVKPLSNSKKSRSVFRQNIFIFLIIRWHGFELSPLEALTIPGSCPLTTEFLISMFKVSFLNGGPISNLNLNYYCNAQMCMFTNYKHCS